jgi:aerobic-type carbon monoxide dehydrogenase small subunit (CoxS/CutS family)
VNKVGLHQVRVTINGKTLVDEVEPRLLLSDFIRENCGLTGTHVGCEHGVCGSCTVIVNDSAVRSCLMFAVQADGLEITTVEGLTNSGDLNPLQLNFKESHALQCGFCTSGILLSTTDYLSKNPEPSTKEIKEMLSGHLCRCTGYDGIIKAIQKTIKENKEMILEGS